VKNLRKLRPQFASEFKSTRLDESRVQIFRRNISSFFGRANGSFAFNRAKLSLNSQPSITRAYIRATATRYITHPRLYGSFIRKFNFNSRASGFSQHYFITISVKPCHFPFSLPSVLRKFGGSRAILLRLIWQSWKLPLNFFHYLLVFSNPNHSN
jgi:hypothetical protein